MTQTNSFLVDFPLGGFTIYIDPDTEKAFEPELRVIKKELTRILAQREAQIAHINIPELTS